jgi:hypothetical protein
MAEAYGIASGSRTDDGLREVYDIWEELLTRTLG